MTVECHHLNDESSTDSSKLSSSVASLALGFFFHGLIQYVRPRSRFTYYRLLDPYFFEMDSRIWTLNSCLGNYGLYILDNPLSSPPFPPPPPLQPSLCSVGSRFTLPRSPTRRMKAMYLPAMSRHVVRVVRRHRRRRATPPHLPTRCHNRNRNHTLFLFPSSILAFPRWITPRGTPTVLYMDWMDPRYIACLFFGGTCPPYAPTVVDFFFFPIWPPTLVLSLLTSRHCC
jgi:hypothetical protein